MPKISVIIPAYNAERYIARCLESVIRQTFEDLEIIVVDDGSADGTLGIVEDYASRDPRIKIIRHPENMGILWTRKTGIEASQGEYIAFSDSDDTVEADYCGKMYDKALEVDADLVICGFNKVDKDGNSDPFHSKLDYGGSVRGITKALLMDDIWATVWAKLFKKELLTESEISFRKNYNMGEDVLVFYSVLGNIRKAAAVDDCLYNYHNNSGSTVNSLDMKKHVNAVLNDLSFLLKAAGEDKELLEGTESKIVERMYSVLNQCGDRKLVIELARSNGLGNFVSFNMLRKYLPLRKAIVRSLAYRSDLALWYIRR